jgi:hypothetical protein
VAESERGYGEIQANQIVNAFAARLLTAVFARFSKEFHESVS